MARTVLARVCAEDSSHQARAGKDTEVRFDARLMLEPALMSSADARLHGL